MHQYFYLSDIAHLIASSHLDSSTNARQFDVNRLKWQVPRLFRLLHPS